MAAALSASSVIPTKNLFIGDSYLVYYHLGVFLSMNSYTLKGYSFTGEGLWSFFFLRNVLIPLGVLLILVFIPSQWVLAAMIVGGHAHFALAYLYQMRAGKMSRTYLLVALLLMLLATLYFFLSGALLPLFFAVSLFFSTHFAYDEFTLHDEQWSWSKVTTAVSFVALFMALTVDMVYGAPLAVFLASGAVVVGALVRVVRQAPSPSRTEYYLWFLALLVTLMTVGVIPVAFGAITTFIIILHFFNWMIGYGIRVSAKPVVRKRYWQDTVVVIVLCGALYGVFLLWAPGLFQVFFAIGSYYAWAIGHIVLSALLVVRERATSV